MAARGQVSLELALTGKDQLTAVLTKADADLSKLADRAKAAAGSATEAIAAIKGEVTQTSLSISDISTGFLALKSAAETAANKVQQAWAFVEGGVESRNIARTFEQMVGGHERTLENLREASRGTIDDTELMRLANSMALVGVSSAEMAEVVSGSFALAAATGRETGQMVDAVLGALRGEMDALQSAGVQVDLTAAYDRLAESLQKTTKELTEQEKAAARSDAVLSQLSDTAGRVPVDRLSSGMSRLAAASSNVGSALAEDLASVVDPLAGAMADFILDVDGARTAVTNMGASTGRVLEEQARQLEGQRKSVDDYATRLGVMAGEALSAGRSVDEVADAVRRAGEAALLGQDSIDGMVWLTRQLGGAAKDSAQALREMALAAGERSLGELQKSFGALGERGEGVLASVRELGEKTADAFEDAWSKRKKTRPKKSVRGDDGLAGLRDELKDLTSDSQSALRDVLERLGDASSALDRGLADMESRTLSSRRALAAVALEQQLATLDESDAIGRMQLEHEARLEEIRAQTAADALDRQRIEAEEELENLRYAADRRAELREREIESVRSGAESIQAAASALQQYDSTGVGAGLVASLGQVAKSWDQLAAGSPQAIAAVGNFAAGFIKNETARAAVASIVELAAGFASLGYGDPVGAGFHFAASAIYAGVAGASAARSGGAGAAGAAGSAPRLAGGSTGAGGQSGGPNVVVHNYGVLGVPNQTASQGLHQILGVGAGSGYDLAAAGRI
jgi:hypothetical protein